jgi:hypothetical protein
VSIVKVKCEKCGEELNIKDNEIAVKCDCGEWYKRHGSVTAYMALYQAGKKPKESNGKE